MQYYEVWFWGLLEIVFALSGVIVYLLWRQRRFSLRQQAASTIEPDDVPNDFLQKAINRSEARLRQLSSDRTTSAETIAALRLRISALKAEKHSRDSGFDDSGEAFWGRLLMDFAKWMPPADNATARAGAVRDHDALIASQAARIESYKLRLENLENFRTHFFELKAQLSDSRQLNQDIHDAITHIIPAEIRSPEMKAMLDRLSQQNTVLERQLQHVERELQSIMNGDQDAREEAVGTDDTGAPISTISDVTSSIHIEISQIKSIVSTQKKKIRDLKDYVDELRLAVTEKDHVRRELEKLSAKNDEMESILRVLEDENDFLQEQISSLLRHELDQEEKIKVRVSEYEKLLLTKETALTELEQKFAAMEQEYLVVYRENEQLKPDRHDPNR
jgi:hypothetical protein